MTVIFKDKKIIVLKTYKTGSTSLQHYLKNLFFDNDQVIFTDLTVGHETCQELKMIDTTFNDYKVLAVLRYPVQYMNSVYNQFIFEKIKQSKSIKLIRPIDKINQKLGFTIFYIWYCMIHKKKTNIVNANYNLIKTYPCKNLHIINYKRIKEIKRFIPEFINEDFKTYNFRKYTNRMFYETIPKFLRRKIVKDFEAEIELTYRCDYEEVFKKYT